MNLSPSRHPRLEMFLSWFDYAHHDPEPRRMGRGSSPIIPLDSRLKHAGMTDFGKVQILGSKAVGNSTR